MIRLSVALVVFAAASTGCIVTTDPGCVFDAECPRGALCERGLCVSRGCIADGECGLGAICDRGACVPVGGGCISDLECASGFVCDRGACVLVGGCVTDRECPLGSFCEAGVCIDASCADDFDCFDDELCFEGECVAACFDDFDCPEDAFCDVDGVCVLLEGLPAYDPCFSVDDCDVTSNVCQPIDAEWPEGIASNAICTRDCFVASDCVPTDSGYQGTCLALGPGPRLCYETCVDGFDCAEGFDCASVGSFRICLPR